MYSQLHKCLQANTYFFYIFWHKYILTSKENYHINKIEEKGYNDDILLFICVTIFRKRFTKSAFLKKLLIIYNNLIFVFPNKMRCPKNCSHPWLRCILNFG